MVTAGGIYLHIHLIKIQHSIYHMNHVQSVDIYTPTYMKRYPDSSGQIMPKQCTYINPFILASPLIQNTGYFTDLLILALACSSQNSRKIKDHKNIGIYSIT